jgi:hypothetical protein
VRLRPNGKPKAARPKVTHKPKHFIARHPEHCVALDTIEWQADNNRRFILIKHHQCNMYWPDTQGFDPSASLI